MQLKEVSELDTRVEGFPAIYEWVKERLGEDRRDYSEGERTGLWRHAMPEANLLPTKDAKAPCYPAVVLLCTKRSHFAQGLRELIYHVAVHCKGKTKNAIIATQLWDEAEWQRHCRTLERLLHPEFGVTLHVIDEQNGQFRVRQARL